MDIESVIAEATTVAPEPAKVEPVAQTETPEVKEQEPENKTEETQDISKKPDSELTAEQLRKREANRLSHMKSKLAKLTRENREMQAKLATPQPEKAAAPTNDGRPKEEDYQTYSDYIKAEARWEAREALKQELAERDKKTSEVTQNNEVNAKKLQRIQEIATQEQEFAKSNPEYTALYNEHADFMNNLPQTVAEALLEADNASLALFALMKEGRLEALEDMSPYKLSMEIGKAELRGESYLTQRKVSNAPTPMEAARGTGSASKSLADKSVEELLKQFNS